MAETKENTSAGKPSFAGRGHAMWMIVAGANPREKGIYDAAFGHYGSTVATVSFEHEYSHRPELGAEFAADYAERLVACADAMKGIVDPRAYVADVAELIKAASDVQCACTLRERDSGHRVGCDMPYLRAALARFGDAPDARGTVTVPMGRCRHCGQEPSL